MARTFEDLVDLWIQELDRNQPVTTVAKGGRELKVEFPAQFQTINLSASRGSTRKNRRLL